MKMLSGLDGLFLHLETPDTPMHVASLSVLELPKGYRGDFLKDVKRLYARRVPLAPVLSRVLQDPTAVRESRLGAGGQGRPGLPHPTRDVAEARHGGPTRRVRRAAAFSCARSQAPAVVRNPHRGPAGPAGGVLHADPPCGPRRAGERRTRQGDVRPDAEAAPYRANEDRDGGGRRRASLAGRAGHWRAAPRRHANCEVRADAAGDHAHDHGGAPCRERSRLGREGWELHTFAPKTPFNVAITGERAFAGVSIPLAEVHQVATAHQATVNDVVLAICAGALRRYLGRHGGVPERALVAAIPISLREGATEFTTQATMARVTLATDIADPVRRLHAIRDSATAAKAITGRTKSILPTDFPTLGLPWLLRGLASLYGRSQIANLVPPLFNLVVSNVRGPPVPLYFAGARMVRYWPLSIVAHGLARTSRSRATPVLEFGVVTATNAVRRPEAARRRARRRARAVVEEVQVGHGVSPARRLSWNGHFRHCSRKLQWTDHNRSVLEK